MKDIIVDIRSIVKKAQGNSLFSLLQAINKELESMSLSEVEGESS
jgi:hypothetical protein